MTRALTWSAAVAAATLALTACTGTDTAPDPTSSAPDGATASTSVDDTTATTGPEDSAATSGPATELNTMVPVAGGVERSWPTEVGSVGEGDQEFTLFGVHRIDDERVVVSGRISGAGSTTASAEWFEPGFFRSMGGYEFSRVALVDADGVRHLPVRDADDRCLCSLSTQPYEGLPDPQAPAWAVLSVSAGTDTVDVEVTDVGTIEDVPVTDLPESGSVPFGWEEVLSVESLSREAGEVTARTTIANPGTTPHTYMLSRHMFAFPELEGQFCFQGLAAWGTSAPTGRLTPDDECFAGPLPQPGEQLTLDVRVADPGSEQLVILPDAGLPVSVAATGTPAEGDEASLRTYAARTEQAGATVEEAEELTVNLDTEVLFEFDKATLTAEADEALAVAAEALQAQDKRAITVAGHTDGQGSRERNLELSQQRAEAVADALTELLGSDWDVTVEWYGMDRPVAEETGTPEQVQAAQARNRRVEIVVP